MAGAGYKLFNTGDVLTAAQVNTYLQEQVVMVFANATARTTALSGVLAEGMVSFLKDTDSLEIYSGTAWVAYGSGDITGITTGATSGLTGGVTSGTADLKFNTTAKGGLLVGTGSGTVSELGVGTNGQVLTADSTTATGLKWATAGGGGKLLQVVTAASSGYVAITSSNTYADANLSATITPTLNTSKIMVLVTQGFGSYQNTASVKNNAYAKILRGSTTIWQSDASSSNGVTYTSKAYADTSWTTITLHYVDSPASTSALTYKTQWKQADNANDHTLYMNYGTYPSQITLFEIGA